MTIILFLAGGVLLIGGAEILVRGASRLAEAAGITPLVIGLTVVAFGTSAPELAVTLGSAWAGEADLAVGNVVGSNIFNLLAVLGLGSLFSPGGIGVPAGALTFDIPIMIAVALTTLPIFFTGYLIARWEGAVFLGFFAAYTTYLVLDATAHPSLSEFGAAMTWFVLPLTALTLLIITLRSMRSGSSSDPG